MSNATREMPSETEQEGAPDYDLAETMALRMLRQYGVASPPVDPITIARSQNIYVKFASFDETILNALKIQSKPINDVLGFYVPVRKSIYINSTSTPKRKLFTIAHELGHALLHESKRQVNDVDIVYMSTIGNKGETKEEMEANRFADFLLVPDTLLRKYKQMLRLRDLSELFAVPEEIIRRRLSEL